MRLILDLFRRIFEALQSVYTKAETDSALATKADATALTEEAQAREQADTSLGERVDANAESIETEMSKMRRIMNNLGEVIWFTLTIPEDDGTHDRWVTDDGTHESDNNPPTFARYYDCEAWTVRTSSGGVGVVDWGDGIKDEVSSPSADFVLRHKYYSPGKYEFMATGGFSTIKLKNGANNFLPDKETQSRLNDFSPVFHAATIKACNVYSVLQGSKVHDVCFVVNPCVGFTCGMANSQNSTIYAYNTAGLCFHGNKVKKIVSETKESGTSLYSERAVEHLNNPPIEYVLFGENIKTLNMTYFRGSGGWFNSPQRVALFAPNVEKANGKLYDSFYEAALLEDFAIGLPALKYAKNAFFKTSLNEASVIRILKALPDLSADTEHLPDNTLGTSETYYGYRIITFTTDRAIAAVKKPTAEMWAAYDEAVAKGWLVEGFEGTHP